MKGFKLISNFKPAGDQPKAIAALVSGIKDGLSDQLLLGVTGSGKTFTMANIIKELNKPTLIMVHNKTLAAQIYAEMKEFFPENAVEYFISYYDYYQPEAYLAKSDKYIEKDSMINEQIDLMRHSATRSLLEREDVIVVSSISCIYGLGSPEFYSQMTLLIEKGKKYSFDYISSKLIQLCYNRNDINFTRGTFRIIGDNIDIFPIHYNDKAWRLSFFGNELESIHQFDPLVGNKQFELEKVIIYSTSHFVTPLNIVQNAIEQIKVDLKYKIKYFTDNNKNIEAQRIKERTEYDIEMLSTTGKCKGIENYSRYLTGSAPNQPSPTLFNYLPSNALLFVDESHVTIPQIRAMYAGDKSRKSVLVEYGFRLDAALDNRPLTFEEWLSFKPQTVYVSATPGKFENELILEKGLPKVEQIIRPTGVPDPQCIVKPAVNQVEDLILELKNTLLNPGHKAIVTTLTKKMAENLTEYLQEQGFKVAYLHSEIYTLERINIIRDLRLGNIDVLIGINLLREGLNIPECSLVAIMDADKEGFLRSEMALIQTIGRAARNIYGRVILYADVMTNSIKACIKETERRREIQINYNKANNITPKTIESTIHQINLFESTISKQEESILEVDSSNIEKYVNVLQQEMLQHAKQLEFEKAAAIRDKINKLKETLLKLS